VDLIPYLSAVILVSTVATVLLALLSYAAFKVRDKRRPKADPGEGPRFFHRYRLADDGDDADGGHDDGDEASAAPEAGSRA